MKTDMMAHISLQCPRCHSVLHHHGEEYSCRCGKRWPLVDGIPVLTEDTNYYGEIPEEQKKELLQKMDRGANWRDLVWECFGNSYPFLHHIIVDETRNDFRYILPIDKDCVVLDLGAGWGTMSCHFAYSCKQVVALDGTLDRCQFIQRRCQQDRVANVTPICANILSEPFTENMFDAVLMNGVLEWIGVSRDTDAPGQMQLEALKIVRRILKPTGVLYVGIENSHGFKYMLGEMDDHTGTYHISYLERDTADRKALAELKRPYRTYTYDQTGYQKLLQAAGFEQVQFFYPYPDYKSIQYLFPLNCEGLLEFYHRHLNPDSDANGLTERVRSLELHAIRRGHLKDYVASYSIVAGEASKPSLIESIHEYVRSNWTQFFEAEPSTVNSFQISGAVGKRFEKGRINHLLAKDSDSPTLLATFCRSRDYDYSLEHEYRLYNDHTLKQLNAFKIPENTVLTRIADYLVLFRPLWPGSTLSKRLASWRQCIDPQKSDVTSYVQSDFDTAQNCLQELHQSTQSTRFDPELFFSQLIHQADHVFGKRFSSLAKTLASELAEPFTDVSGCLVHGDFTPWNIFAIESDTNLSHKIGVFDWELSHRNALPVLDYARFAYYYLTELQSHQIIDTTREAALHQVFVERSDDIGQIVFDFLASGFERLGIASQKISRIMQMFLMHDAVLQIKYGAKGSGPVGDFYFRMLSALEKK